MPTPNPLLNQPTLLLKRRDRYRQTLSFSIPTFWVLNLSQHPGLRACQPVSRPELQLLVITTRQETLGRHPCTARDRVKIFRDSFEGLANRVWTRVCPGGWRWSKGCCVKRATEQQPGPCCLAGPLNTSWMATRQPGIWITTEID